METPPCLLPWAIAELVAASSHSGTITLADRYGLLAAILSHSLSNEEQAAIDRLLYATYRGRLKIVDELSVIAIL